MYSLEYIEDFFLAENDADGCGSFTAVERSMSDRLLEKPDAFDRGRHHKRSGIVGLVIGRKKKESRTLGIISRSRTDQYFSVFERHFDFLPGEGLPGHKRLPLLVGIIS